MLVNLQVLNGSSINAVDGEIGQVEDVFFDDRHWAIRFLVVDTHPWIPLSQKTLISPIALVGFDDKDRLLNVTITKEMVKNSPSIDEHQTVSREFEKIFFDYYGYGYYWMGTEPWGDYAHPTALINRNTLIQDDREDNLTQTTNHLRSANEIVHYGIDALDGKKGYVKDIVWDTDNWSLCYFVVDTRDWLPGGKKVLISPEQLNTLNLTRLVIQLVRKI